MSIYETLGRDDGIRVAVDQFYERVLADPQLAPYFAGVDMPRLRRHQVQLLSTVTGGPAQYEGRELADAHRGLGITSAHFDRVIGHLGAVLEHLGVDEPTCQTVAGELTAHRGAIVSES